MIPTLTINGYRIPTAENGEFKFLGMPVRLHSSNDEARSTLKRSLQRMLSAIDESPLTRQQKLHLYKHGVCPRLSWPLLVEEFLVTWLLNNCSKAMELHQYSMRHDAVLDVIGDFIKSHLPPTFSVTVYSQSEVYSFPHHITPTNLRPDIVWWCDGRRELWLLELTISYEMKVANARSRKRAKYLDLVEAGRAAGYKTSFITLEVGSRGMLGEDDMIQLKEAFDAPAKEFTSLCLHAIRAAILGSFSIWDCRNKAS